MYSTIDEVMYMTGFAKSKTMVTTNTLNLEGQ